MDLVIPYLFQNDSIELKYALRSFEKYMKYDNLILIGIDRPDWLANFNHIPFRDDPQPAFREANIFLKLKYYIDKFSNGEEFIFANDDQYLLTEWDGLPPYPNKGTLYANKICRLSNDPYKTTIQNTIQLLGGTAHNLDVHAPMCMDPYIFNLMFDQVKWATPYGYLLKSIYGHRHETYDSDDLKFNKPTHLMQPSSLQGYDFFSTNNPAITAETIPFFETLYPVKSRHEI